MNDARCKRLVHEANARFALDLDGFTVLTEAATGPFVLTPLIALLAGASRVFVLSKDSTHGSALAACDNLAALATQWQVADRLVALSDRRDPRIREADIITNLGFVRPIDRALLDQCSPTVAIPLMWETWEFRPEDLDLEVCRARGVPVLGTNERHPDLGTMDYVGCVAIKLLLEASIEVRRCHIGVCGSGPFATAVIDAVRSAGGEPVPVDLGCPDPLASVPALDAIVFAEHHHRAPLLGPGTPVTPETLAASNPGVVVVHIAGAVDREACVRAGLRCVPLRFAPAGRMSVSTAYCGPRPLIDLHSAGLRVGEVMARHRRSGKNGLEAELASLRDTPLAQGFPGVHPEAC